MNDLINEMNLNFNENFSIFNYILNLSICSILLFLLKIIYVKYGTVLSNRIQLSKVLILVGVTTFIIISIVKSSLALSLGLVGALSIIRFRTAIKEPEELGYFFIAIALGLGMGANQLIPTIIGFIILTLVIILLSKNSLNNSISQNLLIRLHCKNENKSALTNQISEVVTKNANQVDVKRINYANEEINFNFFINVSSLEDIKNIHDNLTKIDTSIDVTFISSEI
ncbi:DUF4956 domain-containing protein [uncultured Aquimarina sp.]|uniref:DUF4956 domain-containing protein n=1 Tax=uncultured Aquimarina sp. TaxID=575652 RepID=UPI002632162A|nr:DUF4956 domain-containing protein [uncultured Aquimarina sp.]